MFYIFGRFLSGNRLGISFSLEEEIPKGEEIVNNSIFLFSRENAKTSLLKYIEFVLL